MKSAKQKGPLSFTKRDFAKNFWQNDHKKRNFSSKKKEKKIFKHAAGYRHDEKGKAKGAYIFHSIKRDFANIFLQNDHKKRNFE